MLAEVKVDLFEVAIGIAGPVVLEKREDTVRLSDSSDPTNLAALADEPSRRQDTFSSRNS